MINKDRAEKLAEVRTLVTLIQNSSASDEEKERFMSSVKQLSFWRDESNPSPRKANRAARGKRPYK